MYARYAKMVQGLRISDLLSDISEMRKIREITASEVWMNTFIHLLPSDFRRKIAWFYSSTNQIKKLISTERLGIEPVHPYNSIPVVYNSVKDISVHQTFYSSLPRLLHWEDRNSMANSVESRVPFLDHRLVEFSYSLPDDFLKKDGVTKRILNEAMKNRIPEIIRNRYDKMGFVTPEEYWVKNENPSAFRKMLSDSIEISDGIIKPTALEYFDKMVKESIPFDYVYWRFILLGVWIQRFDVKI